MMAEKNSLGFSGRGRRRIAVFGGSFNPVHNGHLLIAGDLVRRGLADEVLFVPARTPPHKHGNNLLRGEIRLEMVRLAIEPYPEFSVSDIELTSERKTGYTIDTMAALSRAFVDAELSFLIGTDSLCDLHNWFHAAELVGRFNIITYPRPGFPLPARADLAVRLGPKNAGRLLDSVVDCPSVPISATQVREALANGRTLAGLLPERVAAFIAANKLYTDTEERID